MRQDVSHAIPWRRIDTVLLDMDGTVLDLRFDNHFWLEYMPRRYGEKQGLSVDQARTELLARYRRVEGTLAWYCIDYWAGQLNMDVAALKREVQHLIAVRPNALALLDALRKAGKRLLLVTNAHAHSLSLKMEKTRLQGHFDALICAHDLGLPKEHPEFWPRLRTRQPFDPDRTLLIDDNLAILRTAQQFGIAYLLQVLQPDSTQTPHSPDTFPAVHDFAELLPL
ncbi:MAG: GMP/IMP nucleotidase [Gammaproteobacteria bacterium]|nr:GMP/IMP nucleotidase [Gammaproteobacteria bacterium]MCP5425810.1 GMP/IMP nucleotidase [Gammaproteobacteria bacterium]MCP5458579.1 GMP/IMP nucleotidase [Gammaproteobacteria bacterium]